MSRFTGTEKLSGLENRDNSELQNVRAKNLKIGS